MVNTPFGITVNNDMIHIHVDRVRNCELQYKV